jgi:hypothetical protein
MSYLTSPFSADVESLARDFDRRSLARELESSSDRSHFWNLMWPFSRSKPVTELPIACQCETACC